VIAIMSWWPFGNKKTFPLSNPEVARKFLKELVEYGTNPTLASVMSH
jgi:hypothetical protein